MDDRFPDDPTFPAVEPIAAMDQVNVTQASRQLPNLLNRVAHQGASFDLTRGGRRILRLVPVGPAKAVKVSDLGVLFARLPALGDDAEAFERDIADTASALVQNRDPWI